MNSDLEDVKREVAAANRVLANLGLATGLTAALGHASMRVPSEPNHFFVKGREYEFDALAIMEPDDMVMCDTEGFLIAGRPGLTQCSEVKIHACIYKTHPQVQSVVHVHPRYTILMSVLTGSLRPMRQEGAQLLRHALADLSPRQDHPERRRRHGACQPVGREPSDTAAWPWRRNDGKKPLRSGDGHGAAGGAGADELPRLLRAGQGLYLPKRRSTRRDVESHTALRAAALQGCSQRPPAAARRHLELPEASGIKEGVT